MIPKTELNKRRRESRKDRGLVEVRVDVTPEQRDQIYRLLERPLPKPRLCRTLHDTKLIDC